jgi:hypothetical protein
MGGGRALIVKFMVGGGRRSILAQVELGQGEISHAGMQAFEGGQAAKIQRD